MTDNGRQVLRVFEIYTIISWIVVAAAIAYTYWRGNRPEGIGGWLIRAFILLFAPGVVFIAIFVGAATLGGTW
ncbi:MAG: hypothetical protein WA843_00275 [Candidatus Saccharimonadales bacterium]